MSLWRAGSSIFVMREGKREIWDVNAVVDCLSCSIKFAVLWIQNNYFSVSASKNQSEWSRVNWSRLSKPSVSPRDSYSPNFILKSSLWLPNVYSSTFYWLAIVNDNALQFVNWNVNLKLNLSYALVKFLVLLAPITRETLPIHTW
jgi:hypothetical protein